MTDQDNQKQQKEIWKQEAEQQKKDLNNRPKKVIRNPVTIRFGSTPNKKTPFPKQTKNQSNTTEDLFARRQLGLE